MVVYTVFYTVYMTDRWGAQSRLHTHIVKTTFSGT
jgi:hypothetical protein